MSGDPEPASLRVGDLEIDRARRRVTVAGLRLDLTGREFALLLYFVDRDNRLVTRSDLLEKVWMQRFDSGSNLVEVYVRRLRKKLRTHAAVIETVRGFGYCFRSAAW